MKKVYLMVVMLMTLCFPVMAEETKTSELNNVEAYDINVNINSLARYLELSQDQLSIVEDIQMAFSDGIRYAAIMPTDERRKNMINNAIEYDLQNMKYVLSKEQYKRYLKVLNQTLINRGIVF